MDSAASRAERTSDAARARSGLPLLAGMVALVVVTALIAGGPGEAVILGLLVPAAAVPSALWSRPADSFGSRMRLGALSVAAYVAILLVIAGIATSS